MENFEIGPALQYTGSQFRMVDAQKSTAEAIGGSGCSEVGVIFGVEFTFGMEPNLVKHSSKIEHAVDFFVGAFGFRVHWNKGLIEWQTLQPSRQQRYPYGLGQSVRSD